MLTCASTNTISASFGITMVEYTWVIMEMIVAIKDGMQQKKLDCSIYLEQHRELELVVCRQKPLGHLEQ